MAENLPVGRRKRLVRPYDRIRRAVAFRLEHRPGKYARPLGYILFGILSVAWIYVTFFNTIFDEYGSVVPLIASILFGIWAVSFGLRLFIPKCVRDGAAPGSPS